MPNQVVTPPKPDDNVGYEWLHIDDFTPGIYDFDFTNTVYPHQTVDNTPYPLGSAQFLGTSGCIAGPTGGLVPLPYLAVEPAPWPYTVDTNIFIVGVETNTARVMDYLEAGQAFTTELIIIAESDDGTSHVFAVNSYIVETEDTNAILFSSSATTGKFWGSPYPQWTLLTSEAAITFPVLVFPSIVPTDSQGLAGHMYNYPSLAATTAYGTDDMVAASGGDNAKTGQLICYDGRVLGVTTPNYDWPPGGSITFASNEFIEYTDPPGENTYDPTGAEVAILVPENPFGYGVAGSISAGELFLVKKRGGGVLVLGDIDAPSSVTYLPGVRPTGNFFGKGDSTVLGFIYCSQGAGAWVWNGSNTSQKISSQLDDNFFDCTTPTGMNSSNYGFFVKKWGGGLTLFSNSFVYSEAIQSWWRLNQDIPFYHYVDALDQHQIYALPLEITEADEAFLYTYDVRVPAPQFSWVSNELFPFISKTSDRVIDIREIIIKASNRFTEGGSVQVQVISGETTIFDAVSTDTIGVSPTILRFHVGVKGIENFQITVVSTSPNPTPGSSIGAPTIWSIDVAYRTKAKVASDN